MDRAAFVQISKVLPSDKRWIEFSSARAGWTLRQKEISKLRLPPSALDIDPVINPNGCSNVQAGHLCLLPVVFRSHNRKIWKSATM